MNRFKSQETIQALTAELGIPGEYSAWWTGRRLLQEMWKHKPSVIQDTSFDLRDLNVFNDAARDLVWRCELTPDMIGKWCHHYDKNSAYLSACRGCNMGIEDPVHIVASDDFNGIFSGLPGAYRVSFSENMGLHDDYYLPRIIQKGQEWVTNDVLLYARAQGYQVTIHEAWQFHNYVKVLDTWAKKIWDTRQAFKGNHNYEAYREMKEIALVGVGSFATGKAKHEGFDLIHPNWWADAVGKARVNILCNIAKYGPPVLVETDGLYYVARDANYRTAVPGILDRIDQLGGYKHCGSFLLTEAIYEQAKGLGAGQLAKLFKHAGGEK